MQFFSFSFSTIVWNVPCTGLWNFTGHSWDLCRHRKETAHRIWTYRHSLDSLSHKYFLVSKYNETSQFWAWLTYFKICRMLFLPPVFSFHCMFLLKSTWWVSSLLSCQLYRAKLANPARMLLGFLFLCMNWFRASVLVIFRRFSLFFLSAFGADKAQAMSCPRPLTSSKPIWPSLYRSAEILELRITSYNFFAEVGARLEGYKLLTSLWEELQCKFNSCLFCLATNILITVCVGMSLCEQTRINHSFVCSRASPQLGMGRDPNIDSAGDVCGCWGFSAV